MRCECSRTHDTSQTPLYDVEFYKNREMPNGSSFAKNLGIDRQELAAVIGDKNAHSVDEANKREKGPVVLSGEKLAYTYGSNQEKALREKALAVREVNFDGQIGSLVARPLAAKGADFFVSVHHDSISEAWLKSWDWDGAEQTYTDVKRGFGIFVSADNPDLETSVRCARSVGALLRRAGFEASSWHARKHVPVDAENGVLLIKGAIPGRNGGLVVVRSAIKRGEK